MTITFKTVYMSHEGGTKYYEVIQFYCVHKSVVVRRWGKMSTKRGGGEVKTEAFTGMMGQCDTNARALIASKQKRGYEVTSLDWGLHNSASKTMSLELLGNNLTEHYGKIVGDGILHQLMLGAVGPRPTVDDEDLMKITPNVETKHEPARDTDWGSW